MVNRWLTPNLSSLTSPQSCRKIAIPEDLWSYVTGALFPLTEEKNWEEHGDATAAETVAAFHDAFDNYLVSQCGTMEFINTVGHSFFDVSATWVSGYEIDFPNPDPLPWASDATAALLAIQMLFSSANRTLQINDGNDKARQYFRIPQANVLHTFSCIVPLRGSGIKFYPLASSGESFRIVCGLVGWIR